MHDETDPGAPAPPRVQRIVRRTDDKMVAGVCSGLAHYLGVDPVVVRILWGIALFAGPGFLAYVVAWILLPDSDDVPREQWATTRSGNVSFSLGSLDQNKVLVLVLAVALLVMSRRWFGGWGDRDVLVPLALIGVGAWLLLRDRMPVELDEVDDHQYDSDDTSAPWGDPWPASAGASTTTTRREPTAPPEEDRDDDHRSDDADLGGGGAESVDERDPLLVEAERIRNGDDLHLQEEAIVFPWETGPPAPPAPSRPSRPPAPRSPLGRVMLGLLVLGFGALWIVVAATSWRPAAEHVLAVALAVIGLGLIVSAWFGRARGLIPLGICLVVALAAVNATDVPFAGGMGERSHAPNTPADIAADAPYRLIFGEMQVDLTDVELTDDTTVEASIVAGELTVTVPEEVDLVIDAEVTAGEVNFEGVDQQDERGGIDVQYRYDEVPAGATAPSASPVLTLELDLVAGEIIVVEEPLG